MDQTDSQLLRQIHVCLVGQGSSSPSLPIDVSRLNSWHLELKGLRGTRAARVAVAPGVNGSWGTALSKTLCCGLHRLLLVFAHRVMARGRRLMEAAEEGGSKRLWGASTNAALAPGATSAQAGLEGGGNTKACSLKPCRWADLFI